MRPEEQYFYDINGYLVIENAIEEDLLRRMMGWLEPFEEQARSEIQAFPAGANREFSFDDVINLEPRLVELADNPRLIPYFAEMIDCPRLKSTWLNYKMQHGWTAAHSNHTPTRTCNFYHFNGRMYHNLLQAFYALEDIGPGEGALQLIPGSHKANYPIPRNEEFLQQCSLEIVQPRGSVLLFSHDGYHHSYNHLEKLRKVLIFTYCPGVISNSYGTELLYKPLFDAAPENTWQKYLLRQPNGYRETYPQPDTV